MSSHAIRLYCEGGLGVELLHIGPCDNESAGECLLTDWVENVGDDIVQGEVTVPVRVEWLNDYSPVLHLEPPNTEATLTVEQARMQVREAFETSEWPRSGEDMEYFLRCAFPDRQPEKGGEKR